MSLIDCKRNYSSTNNYQDWNSGKLRRSNAIRVKRKNLSSVPRPIRDFLAARQLDGLEEKNCENLTLVEQIRRGVKLNPVAARSQTGIKISNHEQPPTREKSVYELLVEALARRNSAMQLSSSEDDDEDDHDDDDDDNDDDIGDDSDNMCDNFTVRSGQREIAGELCQESAVEQRPDIQ